MVKFKRKLAGSEKPIDVVDLDDAHPVDEAKRPKLEIASSVKCEPTLKVEEPKKGPDSVRTTAASLLRTAFKRLLSARGVGAEGGGSEIKNDETAAQWAEEVEKSAWLNRDRPGRRGPYRAEMRRLLHAIKDDGVGRSLVERLLREEIKPKQLLKLPDEDLLSTAQKTRREEILSNALAEARVVREYQFKDEDLPCDHCQKVGGVTWEYVAGIRDGFTKAETW
eukprot:CAMPEP_0206533338 /NCGR_PEP_ID=MMETSP0325_2-20121206/4896_1 /ASSEMBLY_ACC=CAM_ASM_000347 /TAXON_ID=2866 /ORGANISM="Crypthecodinium cohnii, Strain Seligo" /LENGTH=222 /DNA_ID=CAMNT_0054029943 /DNA_START=3 /DNA_END=668 /DNA_ORIENTATION=-